jgi:hypothetical protein
MAMIFTGRAASATPYDSSNLSIIAASSKNTIVG